MALGYSMPVLFGLAEGDFLTGNNLFGKERISLLHLKVGPGDVKPIPRKGT
jgi:hypothetical protein